MSIDGTISRTEGFLFLFLMAGYLIFLFSDAKEDIEQEIDLTLAKEKFNWNRSIPLLLIGFVLTIGGANFVIESGSNIARMFGVSEWMIGLFLISLGTSLPELVVSLVAIKKGNADMSIGNIIGSNVANLSVALGGAALISPLAVNLKENFFDIAIMIAASAALLLILANRLYNKAGATILLLILALFLNNTLQTL
jgi:cation:H+ antiporter